MVMEPDLEKKKEIFLKNNIDNVQPHLAIIEQDLIKNGSGYLVGNSVSAIYNSILLWNDELLLIIDKYLISVDLGWFGLLYAVCTMGGKVRRCTDPAELA